MLAFYILVSCQGDKYPQGKKQYETYCQNCHMEHGQGLGKIYPGLHQSPYLTSAVTALPCLIRHGKRSTKINTVHMPAQKDMSELDMQNLINFMIDRWGDQTSISPAQIAQALEECP